jgi:hypothetical protein
MTVVTMANPGKARATEKLHLSDESDIDEDLWASPSKPKSQPPPSNTQSRNRETSHGKQDTREEALQKELESVRIVNEAIEGAIESLAKAKNSMKVCPTAQFIDTQSFYTRHVSIQVSNPPYRQSTPPSQQLLPSSRPGPRSSRRPSTTKD